MASLTKEGIPNIFTYHTPKGDQTERYQRLRSEARTLAESIVDLCPSSREQSLALTDNGRVGFARRAFACPTEPPCPGADATSPWPLP